MRIHRFSTQILESCLNFKDKIWGTCHLYFMRQNLGLLTQFSKAKFGVEAVLMWKSPMGVKSNMGKLLQMKYLNQVKELCLITHNVAVPLNESSFHLKLVKEMWNNTDKWSELQQFLFKPCSVKSVEHLKLLFNSLGSPLVTRDIFNWTKVAWWVRKSNLNECVTTLSDVWHL